MLKRSLILPILVLFFSSTASAQLFKAGVALGANFAQIEGDDIGGYTKPGLHVGFTSELPLNQRWGLAFELLYSQKGSNSFLTTAGNEFSLRYNYAEIPLLVRFHDLKGGLTFRAGVSLGRLVNYKYLLEKVDLSQSYFATYKPKKWDLESIIEGSYMFNNFWGVGIRWNYSLLSFRYDPNSNFGGRQLHNLITLRTYFLFSALLEKDDL